MTVLDELAHRQKSLIPRVRCLRWPVVYVEAWCQIARDTWSEPMPIAGRHWLIPFSLKQRWAQRKRKATPGSYPKAA